MKKSIIGIIVVVAAIAAIVVLILVAPKNEETIADVAVTNVSLSSAKAAYERGDLLEAKKLFQEKLNEIERVNDIDQVKELISKINIEVIFSPIIDECSQIYIVKPKDALSKIAKKYNTTVNLIKRSNNLSTDIIMPGQELKVNTCKFSLVVDKSLNLLFLKRNDEVIKTYIVSTGENSSTPVGSFKIVNKLVDPVWYKTGAVIMPDSPENILGARWLGINQEGYGIHGTTLPQELGMQVTLGCVRMRNDQVEELYDLISIGTEVIIVD